MPNQRPPQRKVTNAMPNLLDAPRPKRERGQILVLFAGGVTLLVMLMGLVIDGGTAFANRRDAQNDADLASMAGAKIVKDYYVSNPALTSSDVYAAIDARMTANGCDPASPTPCTWTADFVDGNEAVTGPVVAASSPIPATSTGGSPQTVGVVVHVSRQPSTYFLGVIGQSTWQVAADATARSGPNDVAAPGTLLPIGTNPPNPFVPGNSYVLTDNAPYGPGAFGWLSWRGQNATGILENSICFPDNDAMTFPVDIVGEPGAHNGNGVRDCLDEWILRGTPVLIPIFDACEPCNGNNASFHVIGLASFVLTGYDGSGPAINNITGRFIQTYGLPSVPGGMGLLPPSPGDVSVPIGLIR